MSQSDLEAEFSEAAAGEESVDGALRIGKSGIYLVDETEGVTSFRLVDWKSLLVTLEFGCERAPIGVL